MQPASSNEQQQWRCKTADDLRRGRAAASMIKSLRDRFDYSIASLISASLPHTHVYTFTQHQQLHLFIMRGEPCSRRRRRRRCSRSQSHRSQQMHFNRLLSVVIASASSSSSQGKQDPTMEIFPFEAQEAARSHEQLTERRADCCLQVSSTSRAEVARDMVLLKIELAHLTRRVMGRRIDDAVSSSSPSQAFKQSR